MEEGAGVLGPEGSMCKSHEAIDVSEELPRDGWGLSSVRGSGEGGVPSGAVQRGSPGEEMRSGGEGNLA